MVWIVLAWALGVSLFVYGWGLVVVRRDNHLIFAGVALLGLIICVASAVSGSHQPLVTYWTSP